MSLPFEAVDVVVPPPESSLDRALRPHPHLATIPPGVGRDFLAHKDEREHSVLRALIEHCGGIDAARDRVVVRPGSWDPPPGQQWKTWLPWESMPDGDCFTQVLLDGELAWIGAWATPTDPSSRILIQWRERFAPGCPADVADAVPNARPFAFGSSSGVPTTPPQSPVYEPLPPAPRYEPNFGSRLAWYGAFKVR